MLRLILLLLLAVPASVASAQPGRLNAAFGTDGVQAMPSSVQAVGAQPSGRLVLLSSGYEGPVLRRLMPDGTPDRSFGMDGRVNVGYHASGFFTLAVEADGHLVVGALFDVAEPPYEAWGVARFTPNGDADTAFGRDGFATVDGRDVAVAAVPGGGFVTSYVAPYVAGAVPELRCIRYMANGSLDVSFGTAGVAKMADAAFEFASPRGAAIDAWGRIAVAGSQYLGWWTPPHDAVPFVARFLADGTPDASFAGGVVTTPIPGNGSRGGGYAVSVAVGPEGIVVGGYQALRYSVGRAMAIRYTDSGRLDPTFGSDGVALVGSEESTFALAVAVEPGGAVLLAGGTGRILHVQGDAVILRLNRDGTLDDSFGTAGVDPLDTGESMARALAVTLSGEIAVVGERSDVTGFAALLSGATAVAATPAAPRGALSLSLAGANPFHSDTALSLDLPAAASITVAVFDLLGRRVATLAEGPMAAGLHAVALHGANLSAGPYVVRAEADGRVSSVWVVLTR